MRQENKDDEDEDVRFTSWANLPFCGITHVPSILYQNNYELDKYQKLMLQAIKRGLSEAINREFRRVILCVCGLHSNDFPWEAAEKVTVQSMNYTAKTMHITAP